MNMRVEDIDDDEDEKVAIRNKKRSRSTDFSFINSQISLGTLIQIGVIIGGGLYAFGHVDEKISSINQKVEATSNKIDLLDNRVGSALARTEARIDAIMTKEAK